MYLTMNQIPFQKDTVVIICHDFIYGPPHELRDYMLSRGAKELLFIGHVNRYVYKNKVTRSYCEYWKNGKLFKKYFAVKHHLPELCSYVLDLFYSVYWPINIIARPIDIFVGAGNINAFAGLLLKCIHKTKKTIYYVIDYAQVRFSNKILNYFYHLMDAICANYSNCTWNYADTMIQKRNAKWHYTFPYQIVVPNGIRIRKDIIIPLEKCNTHELLYMGTLSGFQGVDTAILALSYVCSKYQDTVFTVIGDGKERGDLEALTRKLKLEKKVFFKGFIDDPREMEKRIARASIGVACYDTNHPLVLTTEPGKVKRYLACGIPVIMTDVSPIARDIEKNACGMIVSNNSQQVAKAIVRYFDNSSLMKQSRINAIKYASHFEWKMLFRKAFDLFFKHKPEPIIELTGTQGMIVKC